MADAEPSDFAAHLRACLEPVLGKHTTGTAIKLGCEGLGISPEGLSWADANEIATVLSPLLRTLLGHESTDIVTQRIRTKGGPS